MPRMKLSALVFVTLIAGCAAVDPAQIKLTVEPITQVCGASDREIPVRVTVRNESRGKFRVKIDPYSNKPPYELSWLYYQILDDSGARDWEHGPGDHGPMPPSLLSIGHDDSTEVVAALYGLTPADYATNFRIQFKDTADHIFVSSPFKPCVSK